MKCRIHCRLNHLWGIRVRFTAILLILLLNGVCFAGIDLWVEDPYAWVKKDAESPPTSGPNILSTEQAINEREHASFVIRSDQDLENVIIRVSSFSGPSGEIDPKHILLREVKWLSPAEGPELENRYDSFWNVTHDAMWTTKEPMPELIEDIVSPLRLSAGEARHIWVTVDSRDLEAGEYQAKVDILNGENQLAEIPLRTAVWNIVLPDDPGIIVDQWESIPGPAKLAEKYARFGDEHYVNIRLINYPAATTSGSELDWDHLSWLERAKQMAKYDLRVIISLRNHPGELIVGLDASVDKVVEERVGLPFQKVLKDMVAKLNEAGVPTKRIYIYCVDEVGGADPEKFQNSLFQYVLETYRLVRETVPDIKIIHCIGYEHGSLKNLVHERPDALQAISEYADAYIAYRLHPPMVMRHHQMPEKDIAAGSHRDPTMPFLNNWTPEKGGEVVPYLDEASTRWVRSEQRKGKEFIYYWNHFRRSMNNHQTDGQRFPFWVTWYVDVDGVQDGCATGIWHANWRYKGEQDPPIFTWQPPENQMIHLIEYVRCLPDGDFRMVSSKRLEAFSDGARDYMYLSILEELARQAGDSGEKELRLLRREAIQLLAQCLENVFDAPNDWTVYASAKQQLAQAILELQKHGLKFETDPSGRLVRHRRFDHFDPDELFALDWKRITESASWSPRSDHSSVVHENKIWLMGGRDQLSEKNDVWASHSHVWPETPTEKDLAWEKKSDSADWSPRGGATAVSFKGKIWLIGGQTGFKYHNDVWYSSNGADWTTATTAAPWDGRAGHASLVHDGKIWVIGGYNNTPDNFELYELYHNDVWCSSDGTNWTQATAAAPWDRRSGHVAVSFDDHIWLMGGSSGHFFGDVWRSSDGQNWEQVVASAPWCYHPDQNQALMPRLRRSGHSAAVFNDEMWIFSGSGYSDVWHSLDGETWLQAPPGRMPWSARDNHTTLVYDRQVCLIGGCESQTGRYLNGVWSARIENFEK